MRASIRFGSLFAGMLALSMACPSLSLGQGPEKGITLRYSFAAATSTYRWTTTGETQGADGDGTTNGSRSERIILCRLTPGKQSEGPVEVGVSYLSARQGSTDKAAEAPSRPFPKITIRKDTELLPKEGTELIGGVTVSIDSRGQVSSILMPELETSREPARAWALGNDLLRQLCQKDTMADLLSEHFVILPQGAIKPGHTWTATSIVHDDRLRHVDQSTTWKYEGNEIVNGVSLVKLVGQLRIEPVRSEHTATGTYPPAGMRFTFNGEGGDGSIVVLFDAGAGRIVSVQRTMVMSETVSIGFPDVNGLTDPKDTFRSQRTTVSRLVLAPDGEDKEAAIVKVEH